MLYSEKITLDLLPKQKVLSLLPSPKRKSVWVLAQFSTPLLGVVYYLTDGNVPSSRVLLGRNLGTSIPSKVFGARLSH